MSGRLEGKVCVITGGAGSIGQATARLFVAEGARVMLVDIDEASLKALSSEFGASVVGFSVTDVSRSDEIREMFERTVARFGRVDVIFSNAGNSGVICPLAEFPEDEFDRVLAVHVKGRFFAASTASHR